MDELITKLAYAIDHLATAIEGIAANQNNAINIQVETPTPKEKAKSKKTEVKPEETTPEETNIKEHYIITMNAEPKEEDTKKEDEKQKCTLDEIRTKCAELTRTGKREQVKELLDEFKVDKLTALGEDKYNKFMEGVLSI